MFVGRGMKARVCRQVFVGSGMKARVCRQATGDDDVYYYIYIWQPVQRSTRSSLSLASGNGHQELSKLTKNASFWSWVLHSSAETGSARLTGETHARTHAWFVLYQYSGCTHFTVVWGPA
jgi:hypothetical protein